MPWHRFDVVLAVAVVEHLGNFRWQVGADVHGVLPHAPQDVEALGGGPAVPDALELGHHVAIRCENLRHSEQAHLPATRGAPQRDALADEGRREQVLRLAHVHPRRGRSAGWVIGGK